MKLIDQVRHTCQPKFVEVGGYIPGFWGRLLGLPIIKSVLTPVSNPGSNEIKTMCIIDFESTPCEIGTEHFESVAFGNQLYRGIVPYSHREQNIYMCSVREIEIIRLQTVILTYDYM